MTQQIYDIFIAEDFNYMTRRVYDIYVAENFF